MSLAGQGLKRIQKEDLGLCLGFVLKGSGLGLNLGPKTLDPFISFGHGLT